MFFMLQYVIYILHKYQALTWHDNSVPISIILIISSLEEIEMEEDVQLHQMYRYMRNSCVRRMTNRASSSWFSRRRTRREHHARVKEVCLLSKCSGLSIPYFPRSADRKTGGGSPVRPPDRKIRQKRLIGRTLPWLASSQMFWRQAHKSLNLHKGLLWFTDEFLPVQFRLWCISREFFRHVCPTSVV